MHYLLNELNQMASKLSSIMGHCLVVITSFKVAVDCSIRINGNWNKLIAFWERLGKTSFDSARFKTNV